MTLLSDTGYTPVLVIAHFFISSFPIVDSNVILYVWNSKGGSCLGHMATVTVAFMFTKIVNICREFYYIKTKSKFC